MSTAPSPAFRAYLFGKAWPDVVTSVRRAFEHNARTAKEAFEDGALPRESIGRLLSVFYFAYGATVLVVGGLTALGMSLLHVLVVGLGAIAHGGIIGTTFVADFVWLRVRGFRAECPVCHHVSRLPVYVCGECGLEHADLEPGLCGALHHRCRCGAELPSSVFRPRHLLGSLCPNPNCRHELSADHFLSQKVHVALLGGPSAGKSAFLFACIDQLRKRWTAAGGQVRFGDRVSERTFEDSARRVEAGQPPRKTQDHLPPAFHLRFERPDGSFRMLYLYDAAGEIWTASAELPRHLYLDRLAGIVQVVDPFAQAVVRDTVSDETLAEVLPSALDPLAALQALVLTLARLAPTRQSQLYPFPLALVVTKADALAPSLDSALQRDVAGTARAWGLGATLDLAAATFADTGVFRSAALRRTTTYSPTGVVEPLLWMLHRRDPEFWVLPD